MILKWVILWERHIHHRIYHFLWKPIHTGCRILASLTFESSSKVGQQDYLTFVIRETLVSVAISCLLEQDYSHSQFWAILRQRRKAEICCRIGQTSLSPVWHLIWCECISLQILLTARPKIFVSLRLRSPHCSSPRNCFFWQYFLSDQKMITFQQIYVPFC